jgi:hypothetical protein
MSFCVPAQLPSTSRAVSFIGIRCYSAPRCERRRLESVSEFSQQQHALCAIHDRVRSEHHRSPQGRPAGVWRATGSRFTLACNTSRLAHVWTSVRDHVAAPRAGAPPRPHAGLGRLARPPATAGGVARGSACVPRRSYLICETGAARAYHAHTHGEGRRSALGVPRAGRATRSDVALRKNE